VNPAMSRCPGQPASGRSRFGVAASEVEEHVRLPPSVARPCGFPLSAAAATQSYRPSR
jgi:hypothetical protein